MSSRSPRLPLEPELPPAAWPASDDPFAVAARTVPPPRSPELPNFQPAPPQPLPRQAPATSPFEATLAQALQSNIAPAPEVAAPPPRGPVNPPLTPAQVLPGAPRPSPPPRRPGDPRLRQTARVRRTRSAGKPPAIAPDPKARRAQRDYFFEQLNRLLQGKLLVALFIFWALLWLFGGAAVVRLVSAPPAPEAPLAASSPDPSQPLPNQPLSRESPNSPAAQLASEQFSESEFTRPANSGPPVGLLGGMVVLSGMIGWWRLQQMKRSP